MIRRKVRASRADNNARRLALGAAIDRAHLETAGAIVAGDPLAHAAALRAARELVEQQMAADAVAVQLRGPVYELRLLGRRATCTSSQTGAVHNWATATRREWITHRDTSINPDIDPETGAGS